MAKKKAVKKVPVAQICPRENCDEDREYILSIAIAMLLGKRIPAIIVAEKGSRASDDWVETAKEWGSYPVQFRKRHQFLLGNGHHRLAAAKLAGLKEVPTVISKDGDIFGPQPKVMWTQPRGKKILPLVEKLVKELHDHYSDCC